MTTGEPGAGYRTVQVDHERDLRRRMLFAEVRKAPAYRQVVAGVAPDDREAIERAAVALSLVCKGRPCVWACELVSDDLRGRFDPDRQPRSLARARHRVIEVSASLASMRVDTFAGWNRRTDRVRQSSHAPAEPMRLSSDDWDEIERLAVEAARQVVRDLRDGARRPVTGGDGEEEEAGLGFYEPSGSGPYDRTRIKAANIAPRTLQIEQLALRLTGRAGTRNAPRTDRRWCDELGIDVPGRGKSSA